MKVLFIGFYKTGTKTMNQALDILGYKVSDIVRNYWDLHDDWVKFYDGKGTSDDIRRMFEGYDAAGDAPSFLYWKCFLEAFPDIKLILTVRDTESWIKSWQNQVREVNESDLTLPLSLFSWRTRKWFSFNTTYITDSLKQPRSKFSIVPSYPMHNKETLQEAYECHIRDVNENAPANQLLIFDVKDGWEPLCQFLGCNIPSVPFPHRNKGGEIIHLRLKYDKYMRGMYHEMYFTLAILSLLLSCILYFIFVW